MTSETDVSASDPNRRSFVRAGLIAAAGALAALGLTRPADAAPTTVVPSMQE